MTCLVILVIHTKLHCLSVKLFDFRQVSLLLLERLRLSRAFIISRRFVNLFIGFLLESNNFFEVKQDFAVGLGLDILWLATSEKLEQVGKRSQNADLLFELVFFDIF